MKPAFEKVIVVGAGPSGLLLSVLLARAGISVHILDQSDKLDDQPRAAHYGPPAIPDLRRAGLIDEIRARGLAMNTMCWRRLEDHSYMAGFDATLLKDVDGDIRTACLPLQDLDALMLERFTDEYGGQISWRHKVLSTGQDEGKAWVNVETPEGEKRLEADYIVGCDGANSAIRRSLFGDEYPGFTWEQQIVATNTYYDFNQFGFHDANFIIHPEHFFMAAKIGKDNFYRITYGEKPGLTREQLQERLAWKFETMLPGHPKPDGYKVINFAPYKMHQRLAKSFRVGRFLLAADAAHLCNPWGGLGITGGFVDVGGLFDCLVGIHTHQADESILDLYSDIRREKWQQVIDPISTDNFKRVHDADPATRVERDPFMQMCQKAQTDRDLMKDLCTGQFVVRYDFTQHYKGKKGQEQGEGEGVGQEAERIVPKESAPVAVG